MRLRLALCTGSLVALMACGLEVSGSMDLGSPDGAVPLDASTGVDVGAANGDAAVGSHDAGPSPGDAPPSPPVDAYVADGSPPPPPFDAAGCLLCNGQCVSSCTGCAAGQALCQASRTCGDCTGCVDNVGTARPIQCFECLTPGRVNPVGTCQPNDPNSYCLSGNTDNGYGHCECADAACPGSTEVCMDLNVGVNVCVTCGENTQILGRGTDTLACQGGGKCHANDQVPDCK
jgi:hypothetical protein